MQIRTCAATEGRCREMRGDASCLAFVLQSSASALLFARLSVPKSCSMILLAKRETASSTGAASIKRPDAASSVHNYLPRVSIAHGESAVKILVLEADIHCRF